MHTARLRAVNYSHVTVKTLHNLSGIAGGRGGGGQGEGEADKGEPSVQREEMRETATEKKQ